MASSKRIDDSLFGPELREVFSKFKTPWDIQLYLNGLKYNAGDNCKSPEQVVKVKTAHCAEGAFFGAAALRYIGYEPLVLYMTAWNDDDHFAAVFRMNGHWGAVSKSNYSVLRYREPVYKSIRELVMSYFEGYMNSIGEKTMRAYTLPVNLKRFDKQQWMTTSKDISFVGDHYDHVPHFKILDEKMIKALSPVDRELLEGALLHADRSGLYKPKTKR